MRYDGITAASLGFRACHVCGLVSRPGDDPAKIHCPRCTARLHSRKPHGTEQCWALLITAYILYLPANMMTIMETGSLVSYRQDTILSGVVHLWQNGSMGIAVIVFVASIMVPLFKLIALTYLLISVQKRSKDHPAERTRLYRLVELVGRWSMLDIYVVTLLAALVQMQSLATVKAGPGAIAFGAVVVLTMFAAMRFDPRLIWDPFQKES
ncbi:MAG: paraquat-inducible protein A [Desulfuromonadales bacterium]|nr:paraquat-inducible protein A [Desulfuromonadales bacterium]